ncbi:hypothetical protein Echvi_2223 [Echinicola vietnamensis DSM 17526]|uniref:Uncharacterized protein n=1 Tax=Echinicola vietnamensis (strain DSM 17526 / LMG 23754 / KMM 6221) TaxID=926556 RepID=L0FZK8_ECHVK|nr:hypothetical protein Echvi_2223 [Echinicola vietnamensis DSM 17526]
MFVILYNMIILSLISIFIQFTIRETYFTVNKVFWILIGTTLTAYQLDIIFGINELVNFNPLSGWFFIMVTENNFNFFTASNLLFISAFLNIVLFRTLHTTENHTK